MARGGARARPRPRPIPDPKANRQGSRVACPRHQIVVDEGMSAHGPPYRYPKSDGILRWPGAPAGARGARARAPRPHPRARAAPADTRPCTRHTTATQRGPHSHTGGGGPTPGSVTAPTTRLSDDERRHAIRTHRNSHVDHRMIVPVRRGYSVHGTGLSTCRRLRAFTNVSTKVPYIVGRNVVSGVVDVMDSRSSRRLSGLYRLSQPAGR